MFHFKKWLVQLATQTVTSVLFLETTMTRQCTAEAFYLNLAFHHMLKGHVLKDQDF